jgi:CBS domain containing-hemolysin-like protein
MALLITVLLLLLNGFFVGAEFALVAARRTALRERAESGSRLARLAERLTEDLSEALAGAQLGITMASLGLGFVAEPAIAHLIEGGLVGLGRVPEGVAHTVAVPVALTIVVYFHMVIGEMVPKNIAITSPEGLSIALAGPFWVYMVVFRPAIRALNFVANATIRLFGVDPVTSHHTGSTGEDLAYLIASSRREGFIEDIEHRLLTGALTFSDRNASEVMVPRTEMVAAPKEVTPAQLERMCRETGHSRIPIYEGDLDHVVGFVHVKDLLGVPPGDVDRPIDPSLIRPILVVPESVRLDPLLLEMQRNRTHLALVVDEYGGTAGIVTLEDVVEELLGDIHDEHDLGLRRVVRLGPNRFRVPGMLRIDELAAEIGLELPEGEYETVGGFVMDALGRLPQPGDRVEVGDWTLVVTSLDGRRVDTVEVIGPRVEEAAG